MDRNELLRDRIRESKDLQAILVSTWHPKLSAIPSILENNFQISNFILTQHLVENANFGRQ